MDAIVPLFAIRLGWSKFFSVNPPWWQTQDDPEECVMKYVFLYETE